MKFFVLKKCLKRNVSISFSVSNRWIICEQKEFENLQEKSFQILCHQIRSTRRQKWKNRESMKINFETFFIHSSCNKWKDTIALKSLCHCVWVRIPWSTGDRETERNRQRERHLAKYSFPFCPGLCQKNPGFCLGWRAEVDLKLENFLFKNCLFSFKWAPGRNFESPVSMGVSKMTKWMLGNQRICGRLDISSSGNFLEATLCCRSY